MKKIMFLLIVLVLIVGCEPKNPQYVENPYDEPVEEVKRHYATCKWDYFDIEYVDELNTDRCYAIKTDSFKGYDKFKLNESFQYADREFNLFDQFWEDGMNCGTIRTLGNVWCLRDNSTCLILEERDRLCNVIKYG